MKKLVLGFIVGILIVIPKVYSQTQSESIELAAFLKERGYVIIPMNERATGHLYIDTEINGIPATLFLDTGATMTILGEERTEKLQSRTNFSNIIVAGIGAYGLPVRTAVVQELKMADFYVENFRVLLLSLSYANDSFSRMGFEEVDGIIGADILNRYRAIIDYGNLALYLTDRRNRLNWRGRRESAELAAFLVESGYVAIPINRRPTTGHLYINTEINGIPASLILDTGAGGTVFGIRRAEEFQLGVDASNVTIVGVGGYFTAAAATIPGFRMADFYVENLGVHLLCLYFFNYIFRREGFAVMDGIIGADVLKRYRAIIDYGNLMLYLKRDWEEFDCAKNIGEAYYRETQ